MKFLLKPILLLSFCTGLGVGGLYATGNEHLIRALQLTYLKGEVTANINDYQDFNTHLIEKGPTQEWDLHDSYNKLPLSDETNDLLARTQSAAFLVVVDGKIVTEQYFQAYNNRSKTNSFSMAKSMTTMLVGKAIEDGLIESFDSPVENLIPELKGKANDVSLAHLSAMTSGMDWDEHYYTPFSPTPKLLYGYDAKTFMLSRSYPIAPGKEYYYASSATQVLGIALTNALQNKTNKQTISEYFSEKFWKPLGMNDDGYWHTDEKGQELTFCCVSTNAQNFAKIGQLLLQDGKWNDQQLLSADFIHRMTQANINNYYGHSIWIDYREDSKFFALLGHLGQYILVIPEHNTVVVRLGEIQDEALQEAKQENQPFTSEIIFYAEQGIELAKRLHASDQQGETESEASEPVLPH